jgi:hypothetical protein
MMYANTDANSPSMATSPWPITRRIPSQSSSSATPMSLGMSARQYAATTGGSSSSSMSLRSPVFIGEAADSPHLRSSSSIMAANVRPFSRILATRSSTSLNAYGDGNKTIEYDPIAHHVALPTYEPLSTHLNNSTNTDADTNSSGNSNIGSGTDATSTSIETDEEAPSSSSVSACAPLSVIMAHPEWPVNSRTRLQPSTTTTQPSLFNVPSLSSSSSSISIGHDVASTSSLSHTSSTSSSNSKDGISSSSGPGALSLPRAATLSSSMSLLPHLHTLDITGCYKVITCLL